jgi:hypothetical protein
MNWQPWKDYEKSVEPLDIVGPPCIHCKFWKPQRTYEYVRCGRRGLCGGEFVCFRNNVQRL